MYQRFYDLFRGYPYVPRPVDVNLQLRLTASGGEQAGDGDQLPFRKGQLRAGVNIAKGKFDDIPPQVRRDVLQRLKDTGMRLEEIRRYSDLRYQGDATLAERLSMLYRHRIFVAEQRVRWEEYAQNLDDKIAWYEAKNGV